MGFDIPGDLRAIRIKERRIFLKPGENRVGVFRFRTRGEWVREGSRACQEAAVMRGGVTVGGTVSESLEKRIAPGRIKSMEEEIALWRAIAALICGCGLAFRTVVDT